MRYPHSVLNVPVCINVCNLYEPAQSAPVDHPQIPGPTPVEALQKCNEELPRKADHLPANSATAVLGVEGLIDGAKNGIIVVTLQELAPGAHLGRRHRLTLRVLEVVVEAVDGAVDIVGEGVAIAHTHTVELSNVEGGSVGGALGALLGHAVLEEVLGEDGHEFEDLRHQVGVGRLDGAVATLVVRHGGSGEIGSGGGCWCCGFLL
ncbi:hypothetical protein B0T11DRAFT_287794 [Plectosphaerella cucumerina]|uniref:Uncharacterized protein n=1 Tax=Plectosphaerella cucumerina TaxID=40658 RepID=A0A8K0TBP3_9PEZI|nr:hypothetical protein B0T11DRAFT_287794 [Plectosphaerella cucumerina]